MAENFENYSEFLTKSDDVLPENAEFLPECLNEGIEEELVKAVNNWEEQQSKKKAKSRFANVRNSELSEILEKSQSAATKKNTKWVVNLFEGEMFLQNTPGNIKKTV